MDKKKYVVVNELFTGRKRIGWETYCLPEGKVVEVSNRQLKKLICNGIDTVCGFKLSEDLKDIVPDVEGFFCKNWMEKRRLNHLKPKYETERNPFFIVVGLREINGEKRYDVISPWYERRTFDEELLEAALRMGAISAGADLIDDKVVVSPLLIEDPPVTETESSDDQEVSE